MTISPVPTDSSPRPSPTLRSLLAGLDGVDPEAGSLDLTIHPDDTMYAFSEELQHGVAEQGLVEYFRSGHHAWRVVDAALAQAVGPRWPKRRPLRLLDFGAGYGRVTRFLLPALGSERMTSTEADADAVTFLRENFGLDAQETSGTVLPETVLSKTSAGSFDLRRQLDRPEGFDAILALSVLTHLPEHSFEAWLKAWLDALTVEGGVLLFSTLGPAAMLPGREMPRSGIHFERVSESRVLDLDDYGTSWVTPDRVGRLLDRLTRGLARWKLVPLGLWNLQDLWLVTLDPRVHWGDDFELAVDQPIGHFEACHLAEDRRSLRVSGWASGGRWPARVPRVELILDGEAVAEVRPLETRPEAAAMLGHSHLGDELLLDFSLSYEAPEPLDPSAQMRIEVIDDVGPRCNGRRHVLHAGSVEATELFLQLRQARNEADRWRREAEVFEASRWGRMRRAWMSWKGRHL